MATKEDILEQIVGVPGRKGYFVQHNIKSLPLC